MLTDAQIQYLEEVLGVSAANFHTTSARPELPSILTAAESDEEIELLGKVLASIGLGEYGDSPDAPHVLVFDSKAPQGRRQSGEQVRWGLPSLKDMLGASAAVTARKREAWATLKLFQQELRS